MRYILLAAALAAAPVAAHLTVNDGFFNDATTWRSGFVPQADVVGMSVIDATTTPTTVGDVRIVATVTSAASDTITGGSTPIAKMVMAHGVTRRGMYRTGIPVGLVKRRLSVHGYHLMAMGLTQPLKVGDTFPLTLTFANAEPVTTTVRVVAR